MVEPDRVADDTVAGDREVDVGAPLVQQQQDAGCRQGPVGDRVEVERVDRQTRGQRRHVDRHVVEAGWDVAVGVAGGGVVERRPRADGVDTAVAVDIERSVARHRLEHPVVRGARKVVEAVPRDVDRDAADAVLTSTVGRPARRVLVPPDPITERLWLRLIAEVHIDPGQGDAVGQENAGGVGDLHDADVVGSPVDVALRPVGRREARQVR